MVRGAKELVSLQGTAVWSIAGVPGWGKDGLTEEGGGSGGMVKKVIS